MGFSIGPISLTFLEAHSWDVRRQVEIVNVPFARQTGFTVGAELVSYQLGGAFYADTDAAAKVIRRQMNELFNNPDIDFEYIKFDLDDDELSGWFLLDSINTQIIPAVFGDYPFSASVRRLGKDASHIFGYYYKANELTNDFSLTGREWTLYETTLSVGDARFQNRVGALSITGVLTVPTNRLTPAEFTGGAAYPTAINNRIRVWDDMGSASEGDWKEAFGPDHIFDGSAIVDNNHIRYKWDLAANLVSVFRYDSGNGWVEAISGFSFGTDLDARVLSYAKQQLSINYLSHEMAIITQIYSDETTTLAVRYKIVYGTWFMSCELVTDDQGLAGDTTLVTGNGTKDANVNNISTGNYTSIRITGSGIQSSLGIFHTKTPTPSNPGSTVTLGYDVPANIHFNFGVFVIQYPLPSYLTLETLGREYLANISLHRVLVDPQWWNRVITA